MESFNNIYDIESPRTSERKLGRVEHSIEQSLLYHNEMAAYYYCGYGFFLMALMVVIGVGIVAGIVLSILIGLKRIA